MHRPAAHSSRSARSARPSRPLVSARSARTTAQRLARTHCAAINRLPGHRTRRTSRSLWARHSRARGGGWGPCQFGDQIGPRRYYRTRDRLACQIRFCGRAKRTAASYLRAATGRDDGSGRTRCRGMCRRVCCRMKRRSRLRWRWRSTWPRHSGGFRRCSARRIMRDRWRTWLRSGKRLARSRKNLARPRRRRPYPRWNRNSFGHWWNQRLADR